MISARGTGSSKHDNELLVKKDGCPIPLQSGCLKGVPPPQSTNEGIKMECSNANCPFKEELMHVECFEAFENNLIKIMSSIGSARGWTNAQRRANLWDKKGLSLIQKFCRCACGMGLLRLDQAEKDAATLTPRIPKTKKAKGKNLPTLNYSGSSTALLAGDKQSEKHENERYPAEKDAATLTPRIPKTKRAKGKNLPTLNYSGSSTALLAGDKQSEKHEKFCVPGSMEHLSLISEPGTFPSKQSGAVTNAGHELCKNLTNDDTGTKARSRNRRVGGLNELPFQRKTDHDTSIGTGSYKAGCMEHLSLISEPGTFPSKQIRGAVTNAGHELCKNLTDDDTGGGRFPASEPLSHPISDAPKPMQQNQTSENDSGACIESLIDARVSISAGDQFRQLLSFLSLKSYFMILCLKISLEHLNFV
uniref:Headcase domain-containing protein n=1 Tax=Ascaris lumbricoides TaxID=6252 RepID=A0A0M3IL00_ASCLU